MAITSTEQTSILNLVVSMFNAAPGAANLTSIAAYYEANGSSMTAVANALASSTAFTDQFAGLVTNAAIANKMAANFGLTTGTAYTNAYNYFVNELAAGKTKAVIMKAANDYLTSTTYDPMFADAAATLTNKTAVALDYSVTKQLSGATIADLRAAISGVDATAASVTTATAAITSGTGTTFTLVTNVIDVVTGTAGNDTIIGDANTSAADQINGGAGTDTLKLYGNATSPIFSNVEKVYLNGNTAGFSVAANSAVTNLDLEAVATGQTYTIANGQAASIATQAAGDTVTIAGNTVTSLNLGLNGMSSTATAADANLALTGTALTTLNVTTSTANSQVTLTNAGAALTTITVAGDKNLELGHALTTVTTINASTMTGAIDVDTIGASNLAFTGGAGNDRINLVATLTAADVIKGGAGTDTVAISDADTMTTALAANVSQFEILEATTADATAYNIDNIITNNSLTGVVISETGGAGITVSNINDAAKGNIVFVNDAPTAVTLSAKTHLSGGTSDSSTVILNNSVLNNADGVDIATSLTYTNVDSLTVQATSADTTAARAVVNSIAGLTATDLDTLIVTGNAAVSITTAATTASLGEINASGSTGAVTAVTTASALTNLIYRGNDKVDTLTANHASTNTATLFTGGGSDVLELGVTGAAHTLTFNATDFTTGDVRANNAITINLLSAFQATDTVTLNFSSAIEGLLKSGGVALSAATSNVTLVGTSFSATTNVIAVDGGNNTTLQFDVNGDGVFTAASDFSIEILGLANNTLNYIAATDVFTFTATA